MRRIPDFLAVAWFGSTPRGHKDTTAKSYDPFLIYSLYEQNLFFKLYPNMYICGIVLKQEVDIVNSLVIAF